MTDDLRHTTKLTRAADDSPVLKVAKSRLVVEDGPDSGAAIDVGERTITVGTGSGCDLVLSDPTASSRHFEIAIDRTGALARDLASTNATYVDGNRLGEVYLRHGALIRCGDTSLRFRVSSQSVEIPLSVKHEFGPMMGSSPPMRASFAIMERAAAAEATILIEGESGTGKELAARAIHERSPRSAGPYVIFDCAATPTQLIESELMGHVRGAFTHAIKDRPGAFESAAGGTLVLDEVGELTLDMQPKLLRAVETRTVQRIGEQRRRQVDVRIIAATNRNLRNEVAEGRFREDLFHRLSVITVRLPPLRERLEEVPELVSHFVHSLGGDASELITPAVMSMLTRHPWPGNVRELRNVAERLVVLPGMNASAYLNETSSSNKKIGPTVDVDEPFHAAKGTWVDIFEQRYLSIQLRRHGGNIADVARAVGLSRQSCYRLAKKHGLLE